MKRKMLMVLLVAAVAGLMFGCGKKKEEPEQPPVVKEEEPEEPPAEPEEKDEEADAPQGMARSKLTGQWIDQEIAGNRPYAVMIGNTVDALPQYGIAKADVIYEVPVEASYTRLMAIFQDIRGLEKIGSMRSCRHYFIYFAQEFDAMYAHIGQAVYAEPILAQENVHNISGMDGSVGNSFYRDSNRKAPHNTFTSEEGLLAATETKGYRTTYAEDYEGHYIFAEDDAPVELKDGEDALVISPGYYVNKPWFVYNEEEGLYYRYEFKAEHMDAATDEQLKVKNIIVQNCNWKFADENGYLDINTIPEGGEGTGKYITNGKMIDITWTKADENSPARYFDASGEEIVLNQGKTWVCIAREEYEESRFAVYETEEALQEARALE